jgi:hypothetical protein
LQEWQCPEPGEEDEDEEWELMRQVLKRARARHETGHKRARIEGKRRAARSDDSGSDEEDEDEDGEGAAEELQLVLVVPQKFTPRGFAFDVEKEVRQTARHNGKIQVTHTYTRKYVHQGSSSTH